MKYVCNVCGWEYDEAVGDPDNGIAPGTKFEDLPDDFVCPLCGVGKEDFEPVESENFLKDIFYLISPSAFMRFTLTICASMPASMYSEWA